MTTQMRHCRCCGAEVEHNGWLDVCNNPECVRKGTLDHAHKKHLTIFPVGLGCFGVCVCDFDDPNCIVVMRPAYFGTEAQAKTFVAYVRAGTSKDELAALLEAHKLPPERITIKELHRRAAEDL